MMNSQPNPGPMKEVFVPPSSFTLLSAQRPSFGKAVFDLPQQYFDAIINPGVELFTTAKRRANWGLIWFQLFVFLLITLLLEIGFLLLQSSLHGVQGPFLSWFLPVVITDLMATLIGIAGFFLGEGILFLIARGFRGEGSFQEQCHAGLVLAIPWGIVLFIASSALPLAVFFSLYALVLQINVLMAVHHLSRGRAISTLLVFIGVVFVVSLFFILKH